MVEAKAQRSKLTPKILGMEGMSGAMTRHFYNNLLSMPDARYLEVGTWKGSSVCSAMCGNKAGVVCVDNWALFNGPKDEFLHNFHRARGTNHASFVEGDCFAPATVSRIRALQPSFNIYLYDGCHKKESHFKALTSLIDLMDQTFIFVVDDWNWSYVRQGTYLAIKALRLRILHKHEILLTRNDQHTDLPTAKATWWNGIVAFVLAKP
jgi:hypothetical protein